MKKEIDPIFYKILENIFEPDLTDNLSEPDKYKDLQLAITLNPNLTKIVEAMKEAYNLALIDAMNHISSYKLKKK